jgi:positive regulator of sigma E activity
MTVEATVEQVKGKEVTVKYCQNADCGTCTACTHGFKQKEIVVKASNSEGLPLIEGDTVEVFLSPWKAIKAGFLVLIFPLLMFFPPYVLASTTLGIQNESVRILFGIGGITLGFIINLILKKRSSRSDLPEIRRILDRIQETPNQGHEN